MTNKRNNDPFKRCRKTKRIIGFNFSPWYMKCLLPLLGIASVVWILVRVLPKPSRASYPCMQVAAPLAASFFGYLGVAAFLAATVRIFQRAAKYQKRIIIGACAVCAVAAIFLPWSLALPTPTAQLILQKGPNDPIGIARGTVPGRVVWAHYPSAVKNHDLEGSEWYKDSFNEQHVIDNMVTDTLLSLTETETQGEAWNEIFEHFNQRRNGVLRGYSTGEKIAIKVNQNCANRNRLSNQLNASPHMTLALLGSLIEGAGVPEENITVYDASRYMGEDLYNKCHAVYPGVRFREQPLGNWPANVRQPKLGTVEDVEYVDDQIHYSKSSAQAGLTTAHGLPRCVLEATYLINMADLKGHNSYATLCSKNWYGSTSIQGNAGLNQHVEFLQKGNNPEREYIAIVDFMAHKDMGEKTALFMINALTGHYTHWNGPYLRLKNPPFDNRWASSLLVSQDMVAIDSVGQDFITYDIDWDDAKAAELEHHDKNFNVWFNRSDKYLVEAALANIGHMDVGETEAGVWREPEWIEYDPEGDDQVVTNSLGVFEHWNNVTDREYTGNMGRRDGIQLYKIYEDKISVSTNGIIEFEAEAFNKNTARGGLSWTSITTNINDEAASLMQSTQTITQNNETTYLSDSPRLDYGVLFPTSGIYYVWIRGHAQNGRIADSDSCHVGLDYAPGTDQASAQHLSDAITGFDAGLRWAGNSADGVRAQMYVPTAGYHLVNLWMQEAGFSVDRIVLTTDADYVPSDTVLVDSITFHSTPTLIPTEGEMSITVDYSSAISRDAVMRVFDTNWVIQTEGRITVPAGSGRIGIPLTLSTPLTAGDTYHVRVDLLEIGGDGTTSVALDYTTAVASIPQQYKLNISSTMPSLYYEITTHENAVFDVDSATLDIHNMTIMRRDDMNQGNLSGGQSFRSNYRLSIESIVLRNGSPNEVDLTTLGASGIQLNLVSFSNDVPVIPLYAEDFLFSEANTTVLQGYDYLTFNLTTPVEIPRGQPVLFTTWYMNDQRANNLDLGFMRTDQGNGSVYPDGSSYYAFYRNSNDVSASTIYPLVFPMSSAPHVGRDMAFGISGTRTATGFEALMEAADHPIEQSAPEDDLDGDGDSNFLEYTFGGDVDDAILTASRPFIEILNNGDVNELALVYCRRTDTNGLLYVIEATESLTNTVWSPVNANKMVSKELGPDFSETKNSLSMGPDHQFFRIRAEEK